MATQQSQAMQRGENFPRHGWGRSHTRHSDAVLACFHHLWDSSCAQTDSIRGQTGEEEMHGCVEGESELTAGMTSGFLRTVTRYLDTNRRKRKEMHTGPLSVT